MRLCLLLTFLAILSACSPKSGGNISTVSFNVPTLSELNAKPQSLAQKVSTSSIDASDVKWANACFMISVTAPDLPGKSSSVCEIPSGIFYGSVAPGSSSAISIDVPKGENRRFVVFAFFRRSSSEPCTLRDSLSSYPKDRVGILGSLANVSLQKDVENLTVDISLPTQMIATEMGLPLACSQQSATGGRFVSGAVFGQRTLVNGYVARASIGHSSKSSLTTPNGFKVYRKRGTSK